MAITFEQVLVFHRIVQFGSFKAAAAELHKTQPAISLAIKKLEEEMEVELFDRTSYRPTLTEFGQAFFERSLKILHGMGELDALSQSFRQQLEPVVEIAIDGISPLPKLLHLFKSFGEKYPYTRLNLGLDILSDTETRVLNREADIGITHFITDHQSLEILPFASVNMIPVMSRELYKEKKVKGDPDLKDIDQIILGDRKGPKAIGFGLLDEGKKWRILDSNFKREIIFAGLGWGHLPLHSIEREIKEKKLIVLDFQDVHPRTLSINLIRHKKHQFGPVAKALWSELADSKKEFFK